MLTKIYLILLAVSVLAMAFFGYYSWSWLQSIGDPKATVENFNVWSNYFWLTLWATSLILLILANVILWTRRSSWALWTTLGYFVIGILLNYFWLEDNYFQFKKSNNLSEGAFSLGAFFGIGICIAAAVIIFFNQFAVLRLQEKMFPPKELPATVNDDAVSETDENVKNLNQ